MTQGVGGKRRVQPCLYKTFLQTGTYEGRFDGSILAELLEDAILARLVLAVSFEHDKSLGADRHDAVLAALALLDVHLLAVKIDVVPFEVACLKGAKAAVVDDREQCLGIQAARPEQAHGLLDGKYAGKFLLTPYLRQGKTAQLRAAHSLSVALQTIDEMLELSLRRHGLAAEHTL